MKIPTAGLILVPALLVGGCLAPAPPRVRPSQASAPRETAPVSATPFRPPLENPVILSRFGARGRRLHTGLDLRRSRRGGEPVTASADGTVVEVTSWGRYGRQVLLRHADGWHSRYAHLRMVTVTRGQNVSAGEVLGAVGASGRASGAHLHFEILTPHMGAVDPEPYLFNVPDAGP